MPTTEALHNALAAEAATLITYIGLVKPNGEEISGGDYARQAVTWKGDGQGGAIVDGLIRPTEDLVFDVPGSTTVAGWRGYSASTGGTDYGGQDLDQETFNNPGKYYLESSKTSLKIQAETP